jgi:hypothetical protein
MKPATWSDIELLALHEPVIQAAVTLTREHYGLSREEALATAVMALVEQVAALRGGQMEALARGDGYVHVQYVDGEFRYRCLDPSTVVLDTKTG